MTDPKRKLRLQVLPQKLAVCRLGPQDPIPPWALRGELFSLTRTPNELSLIVEEENAPENVRTERGFRALVVAGPLQFDEIGILAALAGALAAAGISILAISTFDTDYLFVRCEDLQKAERALAEHGHVLEALSPANIK